MYSFSLSLAFVYWQRSTHFGLRVQVVSFSYGFEFGLYWNFANPSKMKTLLLSSSWLLARVVMVKVVVLLHVVTNILERVVDSDDDYDGI